MSQTKINKLMIYLTKIEGRLEEKDIRVPLREFLNREVLKTKAKILSLTK